jgi:nucleotide-binding universal stress UspA family protein
MLLGSISAAVVREATAPVMLAGPNAPAQPPARFRNLVVGIDGTADDPLRLLPDIVSWAALGLRLWLVQVVASRLPGGAPVDVVEAAGLRQLAGALRDEGVRAEWEVLHCRRADSHQVAQAIVDFGDKVGDAVALVAIHDRTGLMHLALGSVSLDLVHHASWPVLVVPPHREAGDVRS